jgi:hypothetical protein
MKKCDCYRESQYIDLLAQGPAFKNVKTRSLCYGTKECDPCTCGGDPAKCDFYPEKRKMAAKKIKPTTIYYAHHQWKYGTEIEKYELDLIKRYFPNAVIFNPATDLKVDGRDEDDIMDECLDTVRNSDIVVFSSMDGVVGKGVWLEVREALSANKLVLYIHEDRLNSNAYLDRVLNRTDRVYGSIGLI